MLGTETGSWTVTAGRLEDHEVRKVAERSLVFLEPVGQSDPGLTFASPPLPFPDNSLPYKQAEACLLFAVGWPKRGKNGLICPISRRFLNFSWFGTAI